MIHVPELDTVFLLPMKCGTTSIKTGIQDRYRRAQVVPKGLVHNHHHAISKDAKYADCTYVLATRHPVSRLLSLFSMFQRTSRAYRALPKKRQEEQKGKYFGVIIFGKVRTLKEFLEVPDNTKLADRMRTSWSVNWQLQATKTGKPDFLVRQESLAKDFNNFLKAKGEEPLNCPTRRVAGYNPFSSKEDIDLAHKIVERWWEPDFAIGSYPKKWELKA